MRRGYLRRADVRRWAAMLLLVLAAGCGDPPIAPDPPPPPPPPPPPVNAAPVIAAISAQGTRRNEPPNFADLSESIAVEATVTDAETPVDQLQYAWSAPAGSFSGTGAKATWQAPAQAATPAQVTLTLEVIERYGTSLEHRVRSTVNVALHDSAKEVGDMSRQFLIDFSTTSLKDWRVIMRNFNEAACPSSSEYRDERDQVENHYTNFVMHSFDVGAATVSTNFGGSCFAGVRGDACASVPVRWDSTDTRTNARGLTIGIDHLTAVYSRPDSRWWLCSSRLEGTFNVGHRFYLR